MNNTIQNNIYIESNWGLFIGHFDDNNLHRHYALQISISANGTIEIRDKDNKQHIYSACFINSNVLHRFSSHESSLIILINPISRIGHELYHKYQDLDISTLHEDAQILRSTLNQYLERDLTFSNLIQQIRSIIENSTFKGENPLKDDRIYKSIEYLEQNVDRIVSLEEIANHCYLSKTRFLHLFKEKTKLNFRRYQLWNRLIKSLPSLRKHSITQTAHEYGFTDSAHYSRTFKETFGFSPKFLSTPK